MELGQLGALRELNLTGNRLVGPIPRTLAAARELKTVALSNNQLSGHLPAELFELPKLERLHLAANRLHGSIPAAIGHAVALVELDLDRNYFDGPIPEGVLRLPELEYLSLANNRLSGAIPAGIGSLRDLVRLNLAGNLLSGTIPRGIGSLADLVALDLSSNRLRGAVPTDILQLGGLTSLQLSDNLLTRFPFEALTSAHALRHLDASGNRLRGTVAPNTVPVSLDVIDISANPHIRLVRGLELEDLSNRPPPEFVRGMLIASDPTTLEGPFRGGQVVDQSGAPVPGATVTAVSGAGRAIVQTDSDGRFDLSGVAAGLYDLSAELTGFATWRRPNVQLQETGGTDLRITFATGPLEEQVTVGAVIKPRGLSWNSWVNERSPDRPLALRLKQGRRYQLTVDLSSHALRSGLSTTADDRLLDLLRKAHVDDRRDTVGLWVLPSVIGRAVTLGDDPHSRRLQAFTWRDKRWQRERLERRVEMEIDLERLLASDEDSGEKPVPEDAALEGVSADARAGGIQINLFAATEGCATVALSVWDEDLGQPVDYIVHQLQVGETQQPCGEHLRDARVGSGLSGVLRKAEFPRASAALYIAEFDASGLTRPAAFLVPGLISDASATQCGGFFNWEPRGIPSEVVFNNRGFANAVDTAWHSGQPHPFADVARRIKEAIFEGPDEAECGGQAAFRYLTRLASQPQQTLLLRMSREDEAVFLPLGLLFFLTERDEQGGEHLFFQHPVEVSQPLDVQGAGTGCIANWTFALPAKLADSDGTATVDVDGIPAASLVRTIDGLRSFLSTPGSGNASGLVVLGHHLDGSIYFESNDPSILFTEINEPLKPGSAVLLSVCAAGSPKHHRYIARDLNGGGADLMILSPFDVPAAFGIELAVEFSRQIFTAQNGASPVPVRTVFQNAVTRVVGDDRVKAGQAAQFVVAGHDGITVCPKPVDQ